MFLQREQRTMIQFISKVVHPVLANLVESARTTDMLTEIISQNALQNELDLKECSNLKKYIRRINLTRRCIRVSSQHLDPEPDNTRPQYQTTIQNYGYEMEYTSVIHTIHQSIPIPKFQITTKPILSPVKCDYM